MRVLDEPLERSSGRALLDERVDEAGDQATRSPPPTGRRARSRSALPTSRSCGWRPRALVAPRRGRGSAPSTVSSESTSSTSVGSAQCTSSSTSTSGSQRREQLEHPADPPVQLGLRDLGRRVRAARRRRRADEVRERGCDRAQLVDVVRRQPVDQRVELRGDRGRLVAGEDPGRLLDDLRHRPVRDPLAVREAAAPVHARRRPLAPVASEIRRDLPSPGSPTTTASAGLPVSTTRRQSVASTASSSARPTSCVAGVAPRSTSRIPTASQTGPARPCPSPAIGSASQKVDRADARAGRCARRRAGR